MPELPEVETIRRGLQRRLPGLSVRGLAYDWSKSWQPATRDVEGSLLGAGIVRVHRRAKVLMIELNTGHSLLVHLKMTGQLVFVPLTTPTVASLSRRFGGGHPTDSLIGRLPDPSTRLVICLGTASDTLRKGLSSPSSRPALAGCGGEIPLSSPGAPKRWQRLGPAKGRHQPCGAHLFFNDQRKFGWVRLIPTPAIERLDFFRRLGPEPLEATFDAATLRQRLARRARATVKAALLDQSVLAGVGNIYADEALWTAQIHPGRRSRQLSEEEVRAIHSGLRQVLRQAISKGGSTDRNYVDATGRLGTYLHQANVFRRQGQACRRCGSVILKIRVAGRGTHFCPKCQRL